jgi:hypothetical protein
MKWTTFLKHNIIINRLEKVWYYAKYKFLNPLHRWMYNVFILIKIRLNWPCINSIKPIEYNPSRIHVTYNPLNPQSIVHNPLSPLNVGINNQKQKICSLDLKLISHYVIHKIDCINNLSKTFGKCTQWPPHILPYFQAIIILVFCTLQELD